LVQGGESVGEIFPPPVSFGGDPTSTDDDNNAPVEMKLSDSDWDAIRRIMDMGFEEEKVVEAYVVSGKNEEQAVDYLLNNM